MGAQPKTPLIGQIAVHLKMITMDQLAEATAEQARRGDGVRLAELLIEKGLITLEQCAKLAAYQKQLVAKRRAQAAVAKVDSVAAAAPPATPTARPRDSARLDEILRDAVARGASDIHIHAGSPLRLRVNGELRNDDPTVLSRDAAEELVRSALDDELLAQFEARGEIDFCYTVAGVGRFRASAYRQQRGSDVVFRANPPTPPNLAELGLPNELARLTNYHQGLVLVTGPAGCGKSSTLAALVDLINEERRHHILTIEDPIEFVHASKRCLVNQRSVQRHTESFARALRAALREDPDVIVIGELRDLETISLALTAAETGHLVLATLHTSTAIRTINRLVGAFPSDQQNQVRGMLSESLRAVVSQRLIPGIDGGRRVAAIEVLTNTRAIANLIRENKTFQIHSILQTGSSQGMRLLDQSIAELVRAGEVARDVGLHFCEDPKLLGEA
jgi:twitching motility protein PilT